MLRLSYFSLMTSYPSRFFFFFFNDTATTEIYTLSLHDALPIYSAGKTRPRAAAQSASCTAYRTHRDPRIGAARSEEHTSELQSHLNLVCRLLLEKKKKNRECGPYHRWTTPHEARSPVYSCAMCR